MAKKLDTMRMQGFAVIFLEIILIIIFKINSFDIGVFVSSGICLVVAIVTFIINQIFIKKAKEEGYDLY